MAWYSKYYERSPIWAQNIGISAYGLWWRWHRYGGPFQRYVSEFQNRENWTETQWSDYINQRLQKILSIAQQAPAYRELWQQHGFDSSRAKRVTMQTLGEVPITPKELYRRRPRDFMPAGRSAVELYPYYSSGSTGTPTTTFYTRELMRLKEALVEARFRNWSGVTHDMPRAMIGGRIVVPAGQLGPPYWRYNSAERQIYFSAFHIAPQNVADYLRGLEFGRTRWMTGYASGNYFLARLFEQAAVEPPAMRAVLTSSEKLTAEMRELMGRVYRCPVREAWHMVENVAFASECADGSLHVSSDCGIIEILDANGRPCPPGMPGEMVCTGLMNEVQPLVRYRIGDFGVWESGSCACGRVMPVLRELVGRLEDTVVGPDGREMVRFHGLYIGLPVREGQLIQETLDHYRVRIARAPGYGIETEREIFNRLTERLGSVHADFEYVEAIERTSRGKFQAVISNLRQRNSQNGAAGLGA